MSTPVRIRTFDEFLALLKEKDVPHQLDAAAQIVELPSNAEPLPGNLYVKWEKKVPFLQIIQFMILDVPEDRVREIEAAAMRLNNMLEVGGFGFDHSQHRLYCRLIVPAFPDDGVNPVTLEQLGLGTVRNAREFLDAFREVVDGLPGEKIAQAYEEQVKARAGKPPASA